MKKTGFLILLTVIIIACNNEKNIIISGSHPGDIREYLYVTRVNLNNPVFVDSVRINRSGKFKIKIDLGELASSGKSIVIICSDNQTGQIYCNLCSFSLQLIL